MPQTINSLLKAFDDLAESYHSPGKVKRATEIIESLEEYLKANPDEDVPSDVFKGVGNLTRQMVIASFTSRLRLFLRVQSVMDALEDEVNTRPTEPETALDKILQKQNRQQN